MEAEYELNKRINKIVNRGNLSQVTGEEELVAALQLIDTEIRFVPLDFYCHLEVEAKKRIPRDPNDWEIVAVSLALPAAIWTQDYDFFGCGCPTWTTETLLLQLND